MPIALKINRPATGTPARVGLPVAGAVLWYEPQHAVQSVRQKNLIDGEPLLSYGAANSPAGYDQYFGAAGAARPTLTDVMETNSFTFFFAARLLAADSGVYAAPRVLSTFSSGSGISLRVSNTQIVLYLNNAAVGQVLTHSRGYDVWSLFMARFDDATNAGAIRCLTNATAMTFSNTDARTPDAVNGYKIGNNVETGRLDLSHLSAFNRALPDADVNTVAAIIRQRLTAVGITV